MRIAAGEFADEPRRQRRLALATCLILIGCQRSGPPPRTAEPTPATEPPRDLVVRVLDRYRATPVYRDEGIVRLQYGTPSGPVVEETRLAIQLVRPGQLRLELQRDDNFLRLIADGSRLWSQVLDPLTANLRQQVVLRPQPPELGVNELYAATEMVDPANPHEMISLLLSLPFHLQISPLGALLGGSGLSDLVRASGEIAELDPRRSARWPAARFTSAHRRAPLFSGSIQRAGRCDDSTIRRSLCSNNCRPNSVRRKWR